MNVLGYVRVSTGEQADSGAGMAAQRAAILAEAARRGWQVDFIEDAGYSAASLHRPGIALALERLKSGDASVLVVSKMDRLSRSLLDFAGIMQRAQREGWALVALDSPTDLTTASGEAMAGVMAVFAQLERRLISERTRAALAALKAEGMVLGRPRVVGVNLAAQIRALRESGSTLASIAEWLNDAGVPTAHGGERWWPATVRNIAQQR